MSPTRSGDVRPTSTDRSMRLEALFVLFFVSGFPALIYQLTWQRALFRIFGVNIESVTVVVTAFMLGLGLGSLAGGFLSKWLRFPLLYTLAIVELLTAAYGLVSLDVFETVGDALVGSPLTTTAIATTAVVFVPTFLMGATLPLLVNYMVSRNHNVGQSLGTLYYVNTLGAGAACLFCIIALFPWVGMHSSVNIAVLINVMVAVAAIVVHRKTRHLATVDDSGPRLSPMVVPVSTRLTWKRALWLSGLCGFAALSFEIYFIRTVSYVSGSSAFAFAASLGAYLVGLASGARESAEACKTKDDGAVALWTVRSMLYASAMAAVLIPALSFFAWLDRVLLGVALLIIYLQAKYWGASFPSLAHLSIPANGQSGMRTAQLYLANIAGSALGSLLTGFVLLQFLGLVHLAMVLAIIGVFAALLLARSAGAGGAIDLAWLRRPAALSAAAAAALVFTQHPLEALQFKTWGAPAHARIVENRSGIIASAPDGAVYGNGVYDGMFNVDLVNDTNGIVRPFALSLFHPEPKRILMIGLASGSWAQVLVHHPQLESLTVVEINPGYEQLIAEQPLVSSVLRHPKARLVTDDGRRWLRARPEEHFDVIVANATYHYRSNATNLLSREFLELAKKHLRPGGVLFYNTTDSTRAQRTGCKVFAHGARFTNHMVLSAHTIDWNFARWRSTLAAYRIDGRHVLDASKPVDVDKLDNLAHLESHLLMAGDVASADQIELCTEVLARTVGEQVLTDDNMGTEWRFPMGLK